MDTKIIKALDLEEIQKGDYQNISSGHKNLDLELPNGTWPQSCLIEMLSKETTASEMLLLIPTLKKIASQNKYLIMLAPPYLPYIPTFQSFGIREELILVVKTNKVMEKLWVIEQSIRNNSFGALLAWVKEPCTFEKLRKIQLPNDIGPPSLTNPIMKLPNGKLIMSIENNKDYYDQSKWYQKRTIFAEPGYLEHCSGCLGQPIRAMGRFV